MAYVLLEKAHAAGVGSPVTKTLLAVLFFYGFVYTPLIGYVSARMEGIVGQNLMIPFVREAAFMLSGYKGAAIWFVPFPSNNHGMQVLYFRKTELTGTKISSMIKAELFLMPIVLVATVVFSHFIWKIAPVPSSAFPYAEQWWETQAYRKGLVYTSTMPGGEHGQFAQAFHPSFLLFGLGLSLADLCGSVSLWLAGAAFLRRDSRIGSEPAARDPAAVSGRAARAILLREEVRQEVEAVHRGLLCRIQLWGGADHDAESGVGVYE